MSPSQIVIGLILALILGVAIGVYLARPRRIPSLDTSNVGSEADPYLVYEGSRNKQQKRQAADPVPKKSVSSLSKRKGKTS